MPRNKEPDARKTEDQITDEPGMPERFQRALRNALNTPPKHRVAPLRQNRKSGLHQRAAFTRERRS
jgi:hypothetical protein